MSELYTKRCWKCGIAKTLSEFHKNKSNPDGAHSECKKCRCPEITKPTHCPQGHAFVEGNLRLGKRIEKGRRECLTCHRESGKRRYWKDPETRRKEGRDYNRAHKIEAKIRSFIFREKNAEHIRNVSKQSQRKRQIGKTQESLDYMAILMNDPCCYCGAKAEAIDHIHPIAKGGNSHWNNLAAICGKCNSGKKDSTVVKFLWRRNQTNAET